MRGIIDDRMVGPGFKDLLVGELLELGFQKEGSGKMRNGRWQESGLKLKLWR